MTRPQFVTVCVLLGAIALFQLLGSQLLGFVWRPQYEYNIEAVPDVGFTDRMNEKGEAGWELVFARRAVGRDEPASYEMIFKRPR